LSEQAPLALQHEQCYFKHVLPRRPTQLPLEFKTWGGARARAGRPPNGKSAGVSHLRRPSFSRHHPLHVTLRLAAGLPSLRSHALFVGVRGALAQGQKRFGFRLVHFSVQSNHLHLIAEAADRRALSRGVQGLSVRLARTVNGQLERKGRLFADRYHARALTTPRAARYALRYVLLNARKHQGTKRPTSPLVERRSTGVPFGFIDSCSSAPWFAGFDRPGELVFGLTEARAEWRASSDLEAPVVKPKTWLLRVGYRRQGAFDIDEVPGSAL
jgi:putative transposase